MNRLIEGAEAQEIVLQGAKTLFNAVKATYGPVSGNVGILDDFNTPTVTHDGVTVAKNLNLKGEQRVGSELLKQAAIKMEDKLGDGTSTVTILAYSILEKASERSILGESPLTIRRQLEADKDDVLKQLPKLAKKATSKDDVIQVATISSGDAEIGQLVGEVIDKIGAEGTVTVEESAGTATSSEIVEGYTIPKGFVSPYLVADASRMETTLVDPIVLVSDQKLTTVQQISSILSVRDGNTEICIIAYDITDAALTALVTARRAGLNIVAIKAPGFGDNRHELLEDIASLVGAEIFAHDSEGLVFGTAARIVVGEETSTIIGGTGNIEKRLDHLKGRKKAAKSEYEQEQITKRISDLQDKVAIIRVGGYTEQEIIEKKFRVDDAVFAAKAALKEGTVPGCATTFVELAKSLPEDSLLAYALQQPYKVLMENSNVKPHLNFEFGSGTNVLTGETVDLREAGIIDPAKTIREAIQGAVSVAGIALTMKAIIVPEEEEDD